MSFQPVRLDGSGPPAGSGGKAGHVAWLIAQDASVPSTWVIPAGVTAFELTGLDPSGTYAVRSSADVEDGTVSSYAGQFATVLDVTGEKALLDAVDEVLSSATSERAVAYGGHGNGMGPVRMAVMIQRMVRPVVSGVAFSRNPVTGLNEVVIEAIEGRGDQLVSEGRTPARWVVRGEEVVAASAEEAPIGDDLVLSIATECRELADRFEGPLDLEWVWDGSAVWWVQARPITGIGDVSIYSNRISREVMPGMIKPLVWSVNVPMVNGAWVDLFTEVLGRHDIEPEQLAKSFAYRAYFNMGTVGRVFELMGMPKDSLEMLLGLPGNAKPSFKPSWATFKLMPRMSKTAMRLLRFERRLASELPQLNERYRSLAAVELASLTDDALRAHFGELMEVGRAMAYLNIVTPLLANAHAALLRRSLDRESIDYAEVDVAHGLHDALVRFDPNASLDQLRAEFSAFVDLDAEQVRAGGASVFPDPLQVSFDRFIDQFGHFSDSGNDFSVAPWRERRDLVAQLVASAPATRNGVQAPPDEALAATPRWKRARLRRQVARAGRYQLHREEVSYAYTLGYGLFRPAFLEVGRRLERRGILDTAEEVMFLTRDEASALLDSSSTNDPTRISVIVAERRKEMEALEAVEMPEVIYGDDFEPLPALADDSKRWEGVPTSRGNHRGVVRVVRGLDDFGSVDPGDIIVIPFSDVGWTPLFAKAGAVVAESGGVLSHSSIVAREFGIPCVVSVAGAMQMPNGAVATVNGYTGEVLVAD